MRHDPYNSRANPSPWDWPQYCHRCKKAINRRSPYIDHHIIVDDFGSRCVCHRYDRFQGCK